MPFATVDFVDGEIMYRFSNEDSFFQIQPHYYDKEYYQFREVFVLRIWENMHRYDVDLDVFVETFDIIRNNSTEKDRFIRACILEMIWTSLHQNLFSDNSLIKLQTLTKDSNPEIVYKAQKALKLYEHFQSMEHYHHKRLDINNTSQYIDVWAKDSTVNIVFSPKAISKFLTAKLKVVSRENRVKSEHNVFVSQDTLQIDIRKLWKDIFHISIWVEDKEIENVKFIKFTEGPPRFPFPSKTSKE